MPAPSLTLDQIRSTPLGTTPVIEQLLALIDHVSQNQTDIGALTGGGDPGFNSSIDTRWVIQELGGVPDIYSAAVPLAAGNSLVEGFVYWVYDISFTNTGAATLDVGSLEGALPIKKKNPQGIVDLTAGDIPLYAAQLYYSVPNACWILVNPTEGGISHIVQTTIPTDPALFNEGDFIYVIEP